MQHVQFNALMVGYLERDHVQIKLAQEDFLILPQKYE